MVRIPVMLVKLMQTSMTATATSSRNSCAITRPASARARITLPGARRMPGSRNSSAISRATAQKPAESGSPAAFLRTWRTQGMASPEAGS